MKHRLQGAYPSTGTDGIVATFDSEGNLATLTLWYQGAKKLGLELDEKSQTGDAASWPRPELCDHHETYKDGMAEDFNNWSDNSPPYPVPWDQWVQRWIDTIEREGRVVSTRR